MSTTIEVFGTSSDGYLFSRTDSHFSVARDAASAYYISAGATTMRVGLGYPNIANDKYRFYRMYLYFDTSSIPDGATIVSASISLYLVGNLTIIPSGFAIVLGKDTGETYPHDPLVLGDFDRTFYTGGGASTPWVYTGQSGYKTLTFTSLGKSNWINDQGTSKFVVMSSLDVGYTVPNNNMLADFYSQEAESSYWPKLNITYAELSTVTTQAATIVTASGATGNGNITDDGGESITQHGVIWNDDGTDPVDLESADNYTEEGAATTGAFTSAITGCDAETSYYYRAYSTSVAGTSVGSAVQFTTTADSTILAVTTQAASAVSTTTATANGTIVEDAGLDVAAYGFVYKLGGDPGTPADPTTADNYTDKGIKTNPAEGAFTSDLTGLTENSNYYIRAYVSAPPYILRPNAAGDETSIGYQTPGTGAHWDKVDEVVADDATTSVWDSGTSYLRDLYALPASTGSGTISKITVYFRCYGTATGFAKASIKAGSTVADGDENSVVSGWNDYSQDWALNPDDGEAWEWADIDDLQIGVSMKGDGSLVARCTQIYVVVDAPPAQVAYGGLEIIRTGTEAVATLYSSTSDGRAERESSPTYDTHYKIWIAATAGNVDASSDTISVGDKYVTGVSIPRFIRRGFLYFDLSSIPADAEVISAVLSLYMQSDSSYGSYSGWGFVVQKAASWAYPSDPLVVGDFDKDHYSGNYGELLQADFSIGSYNDITLDSDVLNLGGDTRLAIRTNRDIDGSAPGTDTQRYAAFYSANKGTTYRPKLVITYADPQTPVFPKVNIGDAWVDPLNVLVNMGDEWVAYEDLDVNLADSWVEPI